DGQFFIDSAWLWGVYAGRGGLEGKLDWFQRVGVGVEVIFLRDQGVDKAVMGGGLRYFAVGYEQHFVRCLAKHRRHATVGADFLANFKRPQLAGFNVDGVATVVGNRIGDILSVFIIPL